MLVLLCLLSKEQVYFYNVPANLQFIGRDLGTNTGTVLIDGEASNLNVAYDSLRVEVYRENILYQTHTIPLSYSGGIAFFNLSFPINVELASYGFSIYGMTGNLPTLVYLSNNVVAGDVFIIQGQSNAEAQQRSGSSNANQSNFIRVYNSGTDNPVTLLTSNTWHIGQGDGDRYSDGNTGQWGLKLARMLVDSLNVPVAIFNGADPAKEINFFLAPSGYQTSLLSNYGRMYYRLQQTGLRDHVRAVFWSQGERDARYNIATSTADYKSRFLALRNSWLTDYPNIEQFYILQTKNGCTHLINFLMRVKEAQRQLAYENSDITIMQTAALTHHIDSCHFPFTDGYEAFAERLFPLVNRDLYGATYTTEIEPPMILDAFLFDDTTLVVETDAVQLSIDTLAEDFQLENAGVATIVDAAVNGKNIIFTLSQDPGPAATISYLAQYAGPGNFITNQEGLELVCFYRYPIDTMGLLDIDGGGGAPELDELLTEDLFEKSFKVYPNPIGDDGLLIIEGSDLELERLILYDLFAKDLTSLIEVRSSIENKIILDLTALVPGVYLLSGPKERLLIQKTF